MAETVATASDSYVRAEVRDTVATPVSEGTVAFRDVSTGRVVANVSLNARGETGPVRVDPGTYEAELSP